MHIHRVEVASQCEGKRGERDDDEERVVLRSIFTIDHITFVVIFFSFFFFRIKRRPKNARARTSSIYVYTCRDGFRVKGLTAAARF